MVSVPAGPRTQYMDIAPPSLGFPPSEKKYAYPRESDQTIVEELDKIGITEIRIQDLDHPNQQIVLTCFSAFLEDLSYVDDAVVKSIKDYNLQKEVADHAVSLFAMNVMEVRELIARLITLTGNLRRVHAVHNPLQRDVSAAG